MSTNGTYYVFSGHAVGMAAHFHKLDDVQNLNHLVPAQATSVLPATGGLSEAHISDYCYEVDQPRKRMLVCVRRADTKAEGRTFPDRWETEINAEIEAVHVLEKLDVGLVKFHLLSVRGNDADSKIKVSTKGSSIEGLQLGGITAKVVLDLEPIESCGTKDQLAEYYRAKPAAWRSANARRFCTDPASAEIHEVKGRVRFSLAREIQLSGMQDPNHLVRVEEDGYTIKWDGFGRIIVGEVFVKESDRRFTMLRLHMGSDGGGSGSVGDTSSNGQTTGS
jgi:hypothetical protein